jgi:hypothetical protein
MTRPLLGAVSLMRLVLESSDDLERATALASWLNRPTVTEVVVRLPWIDGDERHTYATAIRRLFNDCGCAVATAAFIAAVAASLLTPVVTRDWSWPLVGTSLVLSITAAVAGKLLGLAWTRHRLRALLRRVGRGASAAPVR